MPVQGQRQESYISSLDVLQTLSRLQPLAFQDKPMPPGLTEERLKQIIFEIDPADPSIIHSMRELIRRTIDPDVGKFAPGWSVDVPVGDSEGYLAVVVNFGAKAMGELRPRKLHARPAGRIYDVHNNVFRDKCSLEVSNGVRESPWNEASIGNIIEAANTGDLNKVVLRARDFPGSEGNALILLRDHIIPIIQRESWEDLMQTHGIVLRPSSDVFKDTEVFRGVGSGTGIVAHVTLIYSDSFDVPPPSSRKISEKDLDNEIGRLRIAGASVRDRQAVKASDTTEASELRSIYTTLLGEVVQEAEHFMRQPLQADVRSLLSGARSYYPNAEMAVHQTVSEKMASMQGSEDTVVHDLYANVLRELLTALKGGNKTVAWLQLTSGLERDAPFVLMTPNPILGSDIPVLQRAGFIGAVTPSKAGGAAGHLPLMARSDLFPVLTELYGYAKADGYDILALCRHYRTVRALIADFHPSEGGSNLVLNPGPRLLEHFDVAGAYRVKTPFVKYITVPDRRTVDGQEISVHAIMDNFTPNRVHFIADSCLEGVGLARLESELRYIGEGWVFAPGKEKSRQTLRSHIAGATKQAIEAYEKHSLHEVRDKRFCIRLTDIRPGDPNKAPALLSSFYTASASESTAFLLEHPDDLLVPQAMGLLDAQNATGHKIALLMPYIETNEQIQQVRSFIGEGLDLIAVVESRQGVENMPEMKGIVSFSLGVNDLTRDVLGVRRGGEGYDQLDVRVLRYIQRAKANADAAGLDMDVCSNISEDPAGLCALIGLGIHSISVPAVSESIVRRTINKIDSSSARREVAMILKESEVRDITPAEVRQRLAVL